MSFFKRLLANLGASSLSRRTLERAGVVAVTGLIVSTMALSGVFGPASVAQPAAAEWSDECDIGDSLLGAAYNTLSGADTGCRWIAGEQTDVENLTATDAYASGLSLKDSVDSYTTSVDNNVENSRTVAMSKAKIELVNGLNNGTSESVVHNEVNKTSRDYYSRMQAETVKDWNAKMTQLAYLKNTSVGFQYQTWKNDMWNNKTTADMNHVREEFTLENGTTVNVTVVRYEGYDTYYSPVIVDADDTSVDTDNYVAGAFRVRLQDPDTGDWKPILYSEDYGHIETDESRDGGISTYGGKGLMDRYPTQNQWVIDNLDPYVPEVYNQYDAGQIDSTDLAMSDPSVIALEASTDFNSTGHYSYAAIQLAAIGAAGNVNVSHNVTTGDGTTMEGTLYYTDDDAPENGWETGQQYNMTNFNGTFYFVVAKDDGNASVVDLENYGETFTINEATNTNTGEEVTTTEVQRYTYDSTNVTALEEEIERLKELREDYEAQSTGGGGTGCLAACGDGSSIVPKNTVLLLGAGFAAVLILMRET